MHGICLKEKKNPQTEDAQKGSAVALLFIDEIHCVLFDIMNQTMYDDTEGYI